MIGGKVIAISGTHGTGKTTRVLEIARALKIEFPGRTVATLMEQASVSPLPINRKTLPETQMWLFTSHIAREIELSARFDMVVSDRSAVDAIAYTRYMGMDEAAQDMISLVRHHLPVYSQIYFSFYSMNEFWFPDGLRESKDRRFRQDIENMLLDIYLELGLSFTEASPFYFYPPLAPGRPRTRVYKRAGSK